MNIVPLSFRRVGKDFENMGHWRQVSRRMFLIVCSLIWQRRCFLTVSSISLPMAERNCKAVPYFRYADELHHRHAGGARAFEGKKFSGAIYQ